MGLVTIDELYLAYRQAKTALFYERRGVGLLDTAKFEDNLAANLARLQEVLAHSDGWFDGIDMGTIWVVPKRLRQAEQKDPVFRIGGAAASDIHDGLDVQLRCTPTLEFAVVEVLYLWRFGVLLDALLSEDVLGYRLDLRRGELRRDSRWLFEYWPRTYERFRRAPLQAALRELRRPAGSVVVLSADFASYYDTVHGGFLVGDDFVPALELASAGERSLDEYRRATTSLLTAHDRFRADAAAMTGHAWSSGIPIGPLTSRVVANLALHPLDRDVSANERVLCYRRYVDDLVVVTGAEMTERVELDQVVQSVIPRARRDGETFTLDAAFLARPRCEFALQAKKIRVHHLSGVQGETFVKAVLSDYQRLVSESRAFLDPSVLADEVAKHLVRVGSGAGSPLRVLRDADRARLERFALSTSLQSIERVSSLIDREEVLEQVRATLDRVIRVLDSEDNWAENLDLTVRLLRLAVGADDPDSTRELLNRTDALWGSVSTLQERVKQLYHRNRPIHVARAWTWLRNYLHERRHEAVIDALPAGTPAGRLAPVLGEGLLVRTARVRAKALLGRARLLAASDLRMRDREDDAFGGNNRDTVARDWMRGAFRDPDLLARMSTIDRFLDRIRSGGDPWAIAPARLFLCPRPPSYFDIARRFLGMTEADGFVSTVFDDVLAAVNAVRGTRYFDSVGSVVDERTIAIPSGPGITFGDDVPRIDPTLILGNLVTKVAWWTAAVEGRPVRSKQRLRGLAHVLAQAAIVSRRSAARHRSAARPSTPSDMTPKSLLVLPELSLPRRWFRAVAAHVIRANEHGLVVGLEYEHHDGHVVENQVHAVLPCPFQAAATWSWTKGLPAHEEGLCLAACGLSFLPPVRRPQRRRRVVVRSSFGDFSVLICSELLEASRIAELLGEVELLLAPSWNPDTASYEHVIQTVGLHLNAVVAVANNGHYSDCRAWGPRTVRWQRDFCRLIERDVDSVVSFEVPLNSLRAFRASARQVIARAQGPHSAEWRPLPPDWP